MKRKTPHAIKRAESRFGIQMSRKDLDELGEQCADGRAPILVSDVGGGCRRHAVWFHGQLARAVFDPNRKHVVTVTPCSDEEIRHLTNYVRHTVTHGPIQRVVA